MRSNYQEKRENRIDRYNRLAVKFEGESAARFKRFHDLLSVIPMGQPILVGHHSEAGHRAHLKKADNNMRASIEADKKAAHYSDRAETAERNHAISSDDPEALTRLREKLAEMERAQEHMKLVNKAHAQYLKKPQSLETIEGLTENDKKHIIGFVPTYSWIKHPFAPYQLSNNTGNMGNVKKRIEQLERLEAAVNKEIVYGDIKVIENATENRVQIFFPGKPSDEVRAQLKRRGFRWAPSVGAWQAFYGNYAKWAAEEICKPLAQIPA